MAHRDIILKELLELQSGLAASDRQPVFRVPANYFDNLATTILNRVKAIDAENAKEELALLSPLLNQVPVKNPYTVEKSYFDNVEKRLETIIFNKEQNATEELENLSPLLGELKNKVTYTIPDGYFERLQVINGDSKKESKAKVISITNRKWFRFAAAAMVIGAVAIIGLILVNKGGQNIDPSEKSFAWVQKNMKKVSTDDINAFVELANAGTLDMARMDTKVEISTLLKDVSDKEIQDFLNETQQSEPGTEDDLILN